MGRIHGTQSDARTKEGQYNADAYPGGRGVTASQGGCIGIEQERVCRESSSRLDITESSGASTGGVLCQLITEYKLQLADKKQDIEILESRINELVQIQEQLLNAVEQ